MPEPTRLPPSSLGGGPTRRRCCARARGRSGSSGSWPAGSRTRPAGPPSSARRIGDVIRASCRSDGRVNLAETLTACGDLFVRFGGHAAAAGFELPVERWDAFVERFLALAAASGPVDPRTPLAGGPRAAGGLRGLRRCTGTSRGSRRAGPGTPSRSSPSSGSPCSASGPRTAATPSSSCAASATCSTASPSAAPDLAAGLAEGDRVDVVARLASRAFGGLETLQLEVRDVAAVGLASARRGRCWSAPPGWPAYPSDPAAPCPSPEASHDPLTGPGPAARPPPPRTRTACCRRARRSPRSSRSSACS